MRDALIAAREAIAGGYQSRTTHEVLALIDAALAGSCGAQEPAPVLGDPEDGGFCNVCGSGVRYGERHHRCGEAVMKAEQEARADERRILLSQAQRLEEPAAINAAREADGWRLVPEEPTPEMIAAMALVDVTGKTNGAPRIGICGAQEAYEAMLAAAPKGEKE